MSLEDLEREEREKAERDPDEVRREKERERKARYRAAKRGAGGATSSGGAAQGPSAVEVPREVVDAVRLALASMMKRDLTAEDEAEAERVFGAAVDYWATVRVAAAGPWLPEVAVGSAVLGTAVTKARIGRRLAREEAERQAQGQAAPQGPKAS